MRIPESRWKLLHWIVITTLVVVVVAPLLHHPQLTADDYRYLEHVQQMRGDFVRGFLQGAVVENRWDHLWWIAPRDPVRFYRPVVVLSYWLDGLLHGGPSARGLVISNGLVHLLGAYLVMLLLWRWFGAGAATLAGSALFAWFFCHGEVLWYVAGRTDSLAGLGFLAGLFLHGCPAKTRWLALPCYAAALLSKELTVCLPVAALLADGWLRGGRTAGPTLGSLLMRDRVLYLGYALTAIGVFVLRAIMLGDAGANLSEPYLIAPTHPGFGGHLLMQLRSYGENLLIARPTPPFMQPDQLPAHSSTRGLVVMLAALTYAAWLVWRDRRARWFAVLALMTWLPTSMVYLSERYLYLPSFAVAGFLVVALERTQGHRRRFARALAIWWIAHQGFNLIVAHVDREDDPTLATSITAQLDAVDDEPIAAGSYVYLLNFPANWVTAQFAEATLRVHLDDPTLQVRVLTVTPIHPALGNAARLTGGPGGLTLRGAKDDQGNQAPVIARGREGFPWRPLATGDRVTLPDDSLRVEVLRGQDSRAEELRFELPVPLREAVLLRWQPSSGGVNPLECLRQSRVTRLKP